MAHALEHQQYNTRSKSLLGVQCNWGQLWAHSGVWAQEINKRAPREYSEITHFTAWRSAPTSIDVLNSHPKIFSGLWHIWIQTWHWYGTLKHVKVSTQSFDQFPLNKLSLVFYLITITISSNVSTRRFRGCSSNPPIKWWRQLPGCGCWI